MLLCKRVSVKWVQLSEEEVEERKERNLQCQKAGEQVYTPHRKETSDQSELTKAKSKLTMP
jgi:hypothetical protein